MFEVTPDHIASLNDEDLRLLVGKLAEQEVIQSGGSAVSVTYGGDQRAMDGGIDVRVQLPSGNDLEGYIPKASTGFQVKAEDMPRSKILGEMCPDASVLREAISDLGKQNGAYVIVCSKGSVADTALTNRRNAMAAAIANEPKANNLVLDFYDRQRMASWVSQHPGLIPWVREKVGEPLDGWQPFGDWSSSPQSLNAEYVLDDHIRIVGSHIKDDEGLDATFGINEIRRLLSKPRCSIRLVGLSGVGKTKLIQALFDERIGNDALSPQLAVYTDISDEPNPVPLELLGRLSNQKQNCILIIDNCGLALHKKLTRKLAETNSRISLISVEYDVTDDEPEGTNVYKLVPASEETIERILERHSCNLTNPERSTIAKFSGGNARIALALAATSQSGSSLANLKDSELFERLFWQNGEINQPLLSAAKVCSLVYSFDGETLEGDEVELPVLAKLAGQSIDQFHVHIVELKRRQLVQSRSKWRALLPHALAHSLAQQALEEFPSNTLETTFLRNAPERLTKSFSRRVGYLHDNPVAQLLVSKWLGEGGWLSNVENFNDFGITVFKNVAPVVPENALQAVERAEERDEKFVSKQYAHRDEITGLLRSLAYDPKLFDRSVGLIGKFARITVKKNNKKEAQHVYESLFNLHLSGTHAKPKQRVEFLRQKVISKCQSDNELALSGIEAMLRSGQFSSHYGFEFGTHKRDYGYVPRSLDDVKNWFGSVFDLCVELVEPQAEISEQIKLLLAEKYKWIFIHTDMVDELIELGNRFHQTEGGWPQGWVGVVGAIRSAMEAKRPKDAKKLEALAKTLAPKSLEELIASYVLPEQWQSLDLAEIDYSDDKKYQKAHDQVEQKCKDIGIALANDLTILKHHLPALISSTSRRVFTVFEAIGNSTSEVDTTWKLIVGELCSRDSKERANSALAAFISGLAKSNSGASESLLDQALSDKRLHDMFVHMQTCAPYSIDGYDRLAEALEIESVPTWSFRHLAYGRESTKFSEDQLARLLRDIRKREDGFEVVLEILWMHLYSFTSDSMPIPVAVQNMGRELLENVEFNDKQQMGGHRLANIVKACLTEKADESIARSICTKFLEQIEAGKVYEWNFGELISAIATLFPEVVLDELVENAPTEYGTLRGMFSTLREDRTCSLCKIEDERLLRWAKFRPDTRFSLLAEALRPWKAQEKDAPLEWTNAAREIIHQAPDPVEVLEKIYDRFRPMSWSGSRADLMAKKIPLLEILQADENAIIADWATEKIPQFREIIDQEREREAERDRGRDERFEY